VTTALYGIGDVASQRGRHAEALASFQESLSVAWELRDRLAVVTTLPAVGRALMAADELERAVRVLGATASVAEILAGEVEGLPTMLAEFDEILSAARVRLGESAYGAAWTSGRSPTIEAGVQLALAQVADALAGSPGSRSSGRSGNPLPGGLSEREAEVLRLTAAGLSNAQIAERLYLSPHTIRAHHQRIYTKLDIGNKAEAVRFALENGLT
jgi:DNA-binding CsgD family transcriptional regulator